MSSEVVTIRSTAYRLSDIYTLARVLHEDGTPLMQADVEGVTLRVWDLQGERPHESVYEEDLDVSVVVFDSYQLDGLWQGDGAPDAVGYNFKHAWLRPFDVMECVSGHLVREEFQIDRTNGRGPLWVVHERRLRALETN